MTMIPDRSLSIFVVDDARFSSAYMTRTLNDAGYRNVVSSRSATEALRIMQQRPVDLLLADWMMPEMDGLELTSRVRQIDEATNHFTYIILFTGKDSPEALAEAFSQGVDDFIDKNRIRDELLPRVFAADRIANRQNALLRANEMLRAAQEDMNARALIDPETGLGNQRYVQLRLADALEHTRGRNGFTVYLHIGIRNHEAIVQRYSEGILREITNGLARRLVQQVRPLDIVARLGPADFGVVAYMTSDEESDVFSLRRVHEAINRKEFKTTAGFIEVALGTAATAIDTRNAGDHATEIMEATARRLPTSFASGLYELEHWSGNSQHPSETDRSPAPN